MTVQSCNTISSLHTRRWRVHNVIMTAALDESDDDLLDDADYTGITPSCSSRAAAGTTRHLAAVDCGDGFRESFLVLFLQSSACLTASWEHRPMYGHQALTHRTFLIPVSPFVSWFIHQSLPIKNFWWWYFFCSYRWFDVDVIVRSQAANRRNSTAISQKGFETFHLDLPRFVADNCMCSFRI